MMKQMTKKLWMLALPMLLGLTSCEKLIDAFTTEDNPVAEPTSPTEEELAEMEQSLVGLWWDEYEYADETEEGEPFTNVLLVVQVDEDYTGCIYLGVFDDTSEDPLAVYGGPGESDFTWKLLADGTLELDEAVLARIAQRARTQTRGDGNYGNNMTNVSSTKASYTNGNLKVDNGTYSDTLNKADAEKKAEIEKKLRESIKSNVNLGAGGKAPDTFTEDDIR